MHVNVSTEPGSWVIVEQTGSVPREFPLRTPFVAPDQRKSIYRHSEDVGKSGGLDLDTWTEYETAQDSQQRGEGKMLFGGDDSRRFCFLTKRQ